MYECWVESINFDNLGGSKELELSVVLVLRD